MKQKDILIIVILLFIFVLAWIGESIYYSAINSTISENVNRNIAPIDPNFDTKTIDKLKSRERVTPLYDLENVAPTPIIMPTLPISPNASREGTLLL
jgi:hypothetical protein